jgi:hypothetical protein
MYPTKILAFVLRFPEQFWSSGERHRRPKHSLGLSASVGSMLDSLHLTKVVEGDLAWP